MKLLSVVVSLLYMVIQLKVVDGEIALEYNHNNDNGMMKAVVANAVASKVGDFSNVVIKDIPIPTPRAGEVLIKVAASSVNPVDWKILTGGLPLKFPHTLGFDVSGTIVKCNDCERLKVDDVVWADLGKTWIFRGGELGAYAQYAISLHITVLLLTQ